jgi:2-dehydropantoate 2-reductase
MLQDVEAGRKTEIRDFNGWVVDMASFLGTGLDVSVHQNLIVLIERGEILNKEELARRTL